MQFPRNMAWIAGLCFLLLCGVLPAHGQEGEAPAKTEKPAEPAPTPQNPAEAPSEGEQPSGVAVDEAAVCLEVVDREPVGTAERFAADVGTLACFTRITGGGGQVVVHAWIHEGTTRARVELEVGSDSWRTWSTKQILPSWTGSWEVKIMTPDGQVLKTVPFTVY